MFFKTLCVELCLTNPKILSTSTDIFYLPVGVFPPLMKCMSCALNMPFSHKLKSSL